MSNYEVVFNSSYLRAVLRVKDGKFFIDGFYDRFIASSPEVEEKFKTTSMATQKLMLQESLVHMENFFATKGEADDQIEKVSRIHSKGEKNIAPHLYDLWLECLIDTVRDYDSEFNHDVELAWRMVMGSGITFMKFKYDKA